MDPESVTPKNFVPSAPEPNRIKDISLSVVVACRPAFPGVVAFAGSRKNPEPTTTRRLASVKLPVAYTIVLGSI